MTTFLFMLYCLSVFPALLISSFLVIISLLVSRVSVFASSISHVLNIFSDNVQFDFIELFHRRNAYIAVLDSGAQTNLIHPAILKFFMQRETKGSSQFFGGVQGRRSTIDKYVSIPMSFTKGLRESVTFAASHDAPRTILVGKPFHQQVAAVVDHGNYILTTKEGPIPLLQGLAPSVTQVSADILTSKLPSFDLPPHQQEVLKALLLEFQDTWINERRGKVNDLLHKIILDMKRSIFMCPRAETVEQRADVGGEVDKMLGSSAIRPSNSPYSSEVVVIRKPDGKWRFCIDYRQINSHTVPDRYPLPRINSLLRAVKGSQCFAALDLRAGYWQIPMAEDSIKYTAFRCFKGLFEFVPCGLTNAPATFFGDLFFKGVLVYLDDIIVHASTFDEAITLLRTVLVRLHSANLTLNLDKSRFSLRETLYLDHVIKNGCLHPNPARLKSLKTFEAETTVAEVRRLLGMLAYFQSYIPKFSAIASPITDLLPDRHSKFQTIKWAPECDAAIKNLVDPLATAALEIPLDSDEFLLQTGASDHTVAGILSVQRSGNWFPVEFFSKKFSENSAEMANKRKGSFRYCCESVKVWLLSPWPQIYYPH